MLGELKLHSKQSSKDFKSPFQHFQNQGRNKHAEFIMIDKGTNKKHEKATLWQSLIERETSWIDKLEITKLELITEN